MKTISSLAVLILFGIVTSVVYVAAGAPQDGVSKLERLPQQLEVHLALSAAPPHLRPEATVYVLDPAKGYALERKGKNGFTCYVERTDYTREDFRDDFIVPECQDPEGSRTIVPVEFEIERLRAEGKLSPSELKREIDRRFQSGAYQSPARPGIAYMLSPVVRLYGGPGSKQTYLMNMPHYMFFAPKLKPEDIGAAPAMGPYPYFINPGPMSYIILNVGDTERAQINRDSQALLKEACAARADLCDARMSPKR